MQLFYSASITQESDLYTFPREESKHIIRVLRKQTGDEITLTNGKGYLFKGKIIDNNPNKCTIQLHSAQFQEPLPYKLHIAIAPTKLNDRFEWFLEKSTEIGITEITPIICDHSERKQIKEERFNKILQSAMKQSLQVHLPILHPAISFKDFIKSQPQASFSGIAHCEEGEKSPLTKEITASKDILILIGPEGDFSPEEIRNALASNYTQITLGTSRLRTETAGIVACHSIAFLHQ
ncbi:ribosomal RNA small subunit methyltransferase E [Dokdonia pacifica]|uniref:Ribosomal RNA small subunit methyltransferase E n=1 Tax=Dokdonia pacifica TaxID=1627892 RepID=A0A238YVC2_9FLAO|nr:16S rRNA (uracil(1498)-N(3))-methyltransferase [Dokdonia pacifica]GGG09822.1 ribosomal RNA small subunit methyltransferase E [Dokdonia pacifica]SNR75077.1 16S rRNA (uracil1498-N3)-methyltransferase [Dokdonia pacifica]